MKTKLVGLLPSVIWCAFLSMVFVIVFNTILYAGEEQVSIQKSLRIPAHADFGGNCPFRCIDHLSEFPKPGSSLTIILTGGDKDSICCSNTYQFNSDNRCWELALSPRKTIQWIQRVDVLRSDAWETRARHHLRYEARQISWLLHLQRTKFCSAEMVKRGKSWIN